MEILQDRPHGVLVEQDLGAQIHPAAHPWAESAGTGESIAVGSCRIQDRLKNAIRTWPLDNVTNTEKQPRDEACQLNTYWLVAVS